MYSNLVSIQILVALLKQHHIRHIVISAGQSNNSFARSVEQDDFFTCYSVVDERSAAFFAVGLALELKQPVGLSCTASTACCNYISAVTEAFYREIPLVIMTSNYDIRRVDQMKLLAIHQENMYEGICKKEVQLPEVLDRRDFVYCERLVNEALLALNHHGKGPVHIDVPSYGNSLAVETEKLPAVRAIFRNQLEDSWEGFAKKLANCSKVMILCGQDYYSTEEMDLLHTFSEKYGCVIAGEHMANIHTDRFININPIISNYTPDVFQEYAPEILITMGRHVQFDWMALSVYNIRHWSVCESGEVIDCFDRLTNIFEATKQQFLKKMVDSTVKIGNQQEKESFCAQWQRAAAEIRIPELGLSHVYAIQAFCNVIPDKSILHLSIFNSIRISQYFKLPEQVRCYANLGALGIDGSMSTFIGQASATNELAFLIIGDLSFFYDMNALMIRHIHNNVRILLLNNFGGAEFYQNNGWYDTLDKHTAARHQRTAKGWVESNQFTYLQASSKEEYKKALEVFVSKSDRPVVLEVFNTMENDMNALKQLRAANSRQSNKDHVKQKIKSVLGEENTKKLSAFLKKKH